jgi:hypothetical protein
MLKRIRWLLIGWVLGVATAFLAARRARRALDRLAPSEVRGRVGASISARRDDVKAAVVEGRLAMQAREVELRSQYGLDESVTA